MPEAAETFSTHNRAMNKPESTRTTILIVDDEVQIRRLLRACLEMEGYTVFEAATGKAGIEEAVRSQPQLVLLDMGLPDMEGLAVLKRLREWSQVPVLILSVRRQEDDKIAALDAGANDYLTKPFGTGELLARLRVLQRAALPRTAVESFPIRAIDGGPGGAKREGGRPGRAVDRDGVFVARIVCAARGQGADAWAAFAGDLGGAGGR